MSHVPSSNHNMIPRQWLFGNPERSSPKLSHDGQYLAYLAPFEGVMNIWVVKVLSNYSLSTPILLTHVRNGGIQYFKFCYDNQHIIYNLDQEGDENWSFYSVDYLSQEIKNLTPYEGVQVQLLHLSSEKPNHIAISMNRRNKQLFDVYELHISTGELTLLYENHEYIDFYVDNKFIPRIGFKPKNDGQCELYTINEGVPRYLKSITQLDFISHYVCEANRIGLNSKGNKLYLADSTSQNTSALIEVDLSRNEVTTLAVNENSDFADVILNPHTREPEAVAFNYYQKQWQVLARSIEEDMEYLTNIVLNKQGFGLVQYELNIVSRSQNDKLWLVQLTSDIFSPSVYLYVKESKRLYFLFSLDERLDNLPLCRMHGITISARDGLTLPCYLTLPLKYSPAQTLETTEAIPMVVWVHGGPNSRDVWGLNPIHQWFANRGFAVLSVNFRASIGYGKKHLDLGNGEWGGKIHEDLLDCVEWAINRKIALKDKVAIMGKSFGGYSTLVALTRSPDVFAGGVDIVGPTNLLDFLNQIPPYWQLVYDFLTKMLGGDPKTEEGRNQLLKQSPDQYISNMTKPLLIGHGTHDVRVHQEESDSFADKLMKKNYPFTYIVFSNEGHTFNSPQNRLSFYAIIEEFTNKILGGTLEPISLALKNDSMNVKYDNYLFLSRFTQ